VLSSAAIRGDRSWALIVKILMPPHQWEYVDLAVAVEELLREYRIRETVEHKRLLALKKEVDTDLGLFQAS
jgi:hypothetical protein